MGGSFTSAWEAWKQLFRGEWPGGVLHFNQSTLALEDGSREDKALNYESIPKYEKYLGEKRERFNDCLDIGGMVGIWLTFRLWGWGNWTDNTVSDGDSIKKNSSWEWIWKDESLPLSSTFTSAVLWQITKVITVKGSTAATEQPNINKKIYGSLLCFYLSEVLSWPLTRQSPS